MCRVLSVSSSGYYAWRGRPESARAQQDRQLLCEIEALHGQTRQSYGSPRIHKALKARGFSCGENRIARLMKLHQIKPQKPRSYKRTTDSNHAMAIAENVLDRHFSPDHPDQVWGSDITYISTRERWLYLAVVMDLYSRRIVGWSMQPRLHRSLVLDALKMAVRGRRPDSGLLHHSDRG